MSNVGDTVAALAASGQFMPLIPERSPLTMIAKGLEPYSYPCSCSPALSLHSPAMSNVGDTVAALAASGQFKPLLPEHSPLTMIAKGLEYERQATLKVKILSSIPTTIPLSFPSEFNFSLESTSHPGSLSRCSNTKNQALPHLFNGSLFGCIFYITPVAKPQVSTNSSTHSYHTHPDPILTIASAQVLVADPPVAIMIVTAATPVVTILPMPLAMAASTPTPTSTCYAFSSYTLPSSVPW
jgi:hypothetical protein